MEATMVEEVLTADMVGREMGEANEEHMLMVGETQAGAEVRKAVSRETLALRKE
jgi:hypothetical protein